MASIREKIVRVAMLLMALQFLAQVVALFKQILVAALFGTSEAMDAYLVAMTLVGLLLVWVRLPVRQALIPIFRHDLARHGERQAWANFSALFNNVAVLLVLIVGGAVVTAPYLVALIAPGLDRDAAGLATTLTQVSVATVLSIGLGTALSQVLFSYERFTAPGMKDGVGDLLVVIALLTIDGTYGVYGLAAAAVLGSVAHVALQLPFLWDKRTLYRPSVDPRSPALRELGRLSGPLFLSAGGNEVGRIFDRVFASLLPRGSISALAFADGLVMKPFEFLLMPLHKATFPHFTKLTAEGDFTTLSRQLFQYVRLFVLLALPVAVIAMVLAEAIVRVVYERGAFDETSVRLTSQALLVYALGAPASCLATILNRTFFGLKDSWTPTKSALVRMGVKITLAWIFIHPLAHVGIALAESVSQIVRTALLFALLPVELKGAEVWATLRSFARTLLACAAMAAMLWIGREALDVGTWPALDLALLLALGAGVYAGMTYLLQRREFFSVVHALTDVRARRVARAS